MIHFLCLNDPFLIKKTIEAIICQEHQYPGRVPEVFWQVLEQTMERQLGNAEVVHAFNSFLSLVIEQLQDGEVSPHASLIPQSFLTRLSSAPFDVLDSQLPGQVVGYSLHESLVLYDRLMIGLQNRHEPKRKRLGLF